MAQVTKRPLMEVLRPAHLRRTGTIALVVGTWLTLFNQGDALLDSPLSRELWIKAVLNYLTPFVVANFGLLSRETREENDDGGEHREHGPDRKL